MRPRGGLENTNTTPAVPLSWAGGSCTLSATLLFYMLAAPGPSAPERALQIQTARFRQRAILLQWRNASGAGTLVSRLRTTASATHRAHPATCPGLRPLPTLLATPHQWAPYSPGTRPACPPRAPRQSCYCTKYTGASKPPLRLLSQKRARSAGHIYELPARPSTSQPSGAKRRARSKFAS